MALITTAIMGTATIEVDRMDPATQMRLADEIFAQQPNLLGSVLVLSRMGVGMVQLEVPIRILLCTFQAMKGCKRKWPLITEDIQEACLQRLTGRVRFTEGLTAAHSNEVVTQFIAEHREPHLLAFVYGTLAEHDLLAVRTEAGKSLMLAALNLAECVAYVGQSARR